MPLSRRGARIIRYAALTLAALMALSVASGADVVQEQASPPAAASPPPAFDFADFGRTLYEQRCANCHSILPTEGSIAPPLHDLIGRRAGSAPNHTYSVKLAGSDLVWNAVTLDEWLEKSTIATPDIRFRHVGIQDAIERKAVVAYIQRANE